MNIEYMNLDNGTTIITNEDGEILKSAHVSEEKLLTLNKIEKVNAYLEQLKTKKEDCEGVLFVSKGMLTSQPLLIIFGMICGHAISGFYGLVYAFVLLFFACGVNTLFWSVARILAKRRLIGNTAKIEKAEVLKKEFLQELENACIKEKDMVMNEPISLKYKNSFEFAQIDKDLDEAYYDAVHSKPKKRVLKKNKD